jgi:hypothetical protein
MQVSRGWTTTGAAVGDHRRHKPTMGERVRATGSAFALALVLVGGCGPSDELLAEADAQARARQAEFRQAEAAGEVGHGHFSTPAELATESAIRRAETIAQIVPVALVLGAVLLLAALVFLGMKRQRERRERLAKARVAYETALAKLKEQPSDATLRQDALEAGRAYSNLTRESKGVTLFDEMALKNDLDAAAAGAALAPVFVSRPVAGAASTAERLRSLTDLKAQGLITDDEFLARRAKILEGV